MELMSTPEWLVVMRSLRQRWWKPGFEARSGSWSRNRRGWPPMVCRVGRCPDRVRVPILRRDIWYQDHSNTADKLRHMLRLRIDIPSLPRDNYDGQQRTMENT